jgi:hypothetical protein
VVFGLLDVPGANLADVARLLKENDFRRKVATHCANPQVRAFWLHEYEGYSPALRGQIIAPLQNKVGAFLTDPRLYRLLTAPRSSFDLRQIMDTGGIFLANLSKGRIGEGPSSLLGALLLAELGQAGLSRADTPEEERRDFAVFLDEFQSFATGSLVTMLSELRKYRVGLVLAHQFLGQLAPQVRDAILGNVGTTIVFRMGIQDAHILAREFAPEFSAQDLTRLPNHEIYLKLMVDGVVSRGFSARVVHKKEH